MFRFVSAASSEATISSFLSRRPPILPKRHEIVFSSSSPNYQVVASFADSPDLLFEKLQNEPRTPKPIEEANLQLLNVFFCEETQMLVLALPLWHLKKTDYKPDKEKVLYGMMKKGNRLDLKQVFEIWRVLTVEQSLVVMASLYLRNHSQPSSLEELVPFLIAQAQSNSILKVDDDRYFPFLPTIFQFKEVLLHCDGLDLCKYDILFASLLDYLPTPPFSADSEDNESAEENSDTTSDVDGPPIPGTPVGVLRHRILELERQLTERDAVIAELRAKRVVEEMQQNIDKRQPRKIQRLLNSQISIILTTDEEIAEHFDRFILERCENADINPVKHSVLHQAYHRWALEQHVEPLSIPQIRIQMQRLGVKTGNRTGNRTYKGLKLCKVETTQDHPVD